MSETAEKVEFYPWTLQTDCKELTEHVHRMATKGRGTREEWDAFIAALNDALNAKAVERATK